MILATEKTYFDKVNGFIGLKKSFSKCSISFFKNGCVDYS